MDVFSAGGHKPPPICKITVPAKCDDAEHRETRPAGAAAPLPRPRLAVHRTSSAYSRGQHGPPVHPHTCFPGHHARPHAQEGVEAPSSHSTPFLLWVSLLACDTSSERCPWARPGRRATPGQGGGWGQGLLVGFLCWHSKAMVKPTLKV